MSWPTQPVLVLMGVSGCGKSTVATLLADRRGWPFAEGDEFHSATNIAKMRSGHHLTDADRDPWLARVRAWIDERVLAGQPGIITCSALKRSYRDVLRAEQTVFIYLRGSREQIAERLRARSGHFMPPALLASQFADLQPPSPDEQALTVDIGADPTELADQIETALGLAGTRR